MASRDAKTFEDYLAFLENNPHGKNPVVEWWSSEDERRGLWDRGRTPRPQSAFSYRELVADSYGNCYGNDAYRR